jgi:SAM-dependent methyltransferase
MTVIIEPQLRHAIDQHYHDGIADQYDHIVVRPRIFTIGLLFEGFIEALGPRETMLDLGCGTGHMLLRYARYFRSALGVDHSMGMLRAAQVNLHKAGLAHAMLLQDELNAFMTRCAGSFDLVTCVGVLHHLSEDERLQLLRSIRAICHAHTRIILAEPVYSADPPPAITHWNQQALGGTRHYAGDIPQDPDEAPLDEATWLAQLREVGLVGIAESRMWEMSTTAEYPGPSEREAIRRLVAEHPGGNVLALLVGPDA